MSFVSFDKLSGSTKLFLDFIRCSDTTFKYFKYDFCSVSSYIDAAEWIDRSRYDRQRLSKLISDSTASLNLHDRIVSNIEKLARPDSLVVFSGQQVGMYLGPMYTVIKALTSYKVARKLESALGRPVVPCFWMATDDHDFDEIKTVRLLDRAGKCLEISYEPSSLRDDIPMADVVLDDQIEKFRASVDEDLLETEFSSMIKDISKRRYKAGAGLSSAFAGMFADLLGDFGIVPVDPNFPEMKKTFSPVFRKEIENYWEIFELYESASQELLDEGYHRQVHKSGESLNLFYNYNGRTNIIHENGKFSLQGKDVSFSKENLLKRLDSEAQKFSPNVCLRPVAQCFAFPTVCQIVGPSEAAYYAQIRPIFNGMEVPWPVIKPRLFATLVEPQIKRTLDRLNIGFASLYKDRDHEIGRVIKENFPSEIDSKTDDIRGNVERPLKELSESFKDKDPESYQALEHTRKRIDHELNHLFRKLTSTNKKRHDTVVGQIKKSADFLFPTGKFQERVLSPVYFVNKFGPDVFKKLEEGLDIDSVDHQLVEL
jgi:bacillithiol biosynthesis cysteine-adding enzyme BshC